MHDIPEFSIAEYCVLVQAEPTSLARSEYHLPPVMIRGAMNSKHLFRLYFFNRPVSHLNYLAMLKTWFILQLQSIGIENYVWFQEDGAPAHFSISVRGYLNEDLHIRWIGRGSATLPAPFDLPP